MKIGILADIHGNLDALQSVLKTFVYNEVEKIFCLGDMIGYYHNSLEVLDLLIDMDVKCILGNHEAYLLGYLKYSPEKWQSCFLERVRERISSKNLLWLYSLPKTLEINIDSQKIAFFHGSPWDPLNGYVYPNSSLEKFLNYKASLFFLGHTHYPMTRKMGNKLIVNPGSLGQPRSGGWPTYAVIKYPSKKVVFREVLYDKTELERQIDKIDVNNQYLKKVLFR